MTKYTIAGEWKYSAEDSAVYAQGQHPFVGFYGFPEDQERSLGTFIAQYGDEIADGRDLVKETERERDLAIHVSAVAEDLLAKAERERDACVARIDWLEGLNDRLGAKNGRLRKALGEMARSYGSLLLAADGFVRAWRKNPASAGTTTAANTLSDALTLQPQEPHTERHKVLDALVAQAQVDGEYDAPPGPRTQDSVEQP